MGGSASSEFEVSQFVITAMFAQLVVAAGRASQLLSCDNRGRLYAATTETITSADTRAVSRDLQVNVLPFRFSDLWHQDSRCAAL